LGFLASVRARLALDPAQDGQDSFFLCEQESIDGFTICAPNLALELVLFLVLNLAPKIAQEIALQGDFGSKWCVSVVFFVRNAKDSARFSAIRSTQRNVPRRERKMLSPPRPEGRGLSRKMVTSGSMPHREYSRLFSRKANVLAKGKRGNDFVFVDAGNKAVERFPAQSFDLF